MSKDKFIITMMTYFNSFFLDKMNDILKLGVFFEENKNPQYIIVLRKFATSDKNNSNKIIIEFAPQQIKVPSIFYVNIDSFIEEIIEFLDNRYELDQIKAVVSIEAKDYLGSDTKYFKSLRKLVRDKNYKVSREFKEISEVRVSPIDDLIDYINTFRYSKIEMEILKYINGQLHGKIFKTLEVNIITIMDQYFIISGDTEATDSIGLISSWTDQSIIQYFTNQICEILNIRSLNEFTADKYHVFFKLTQRQEVEL